MSSETQANLLIAVRDLLVGIALFASGLLAAKYLPGYLVRKGENLAELEDSAQIAGRKAEGGAPVKRSLAAARVAFSAAGASESAIRARRERALIRLYKSAALLLGDKLVVNHGDSHQTRG